MRFLIAVNLFISGFFVITLQAQEAISGCNEVKIQGFCTNEVKVAKDVCKDKDKGEDIKKSFADLKGTKVDTNTNLGKLSQKYRDLEKSSKSEAQQKKACVEVSKAARKDCVSSCDEAPSQASCDKSLESIDQVIKYCKKNEEAAEEMAMMAAENAGLYDRPNFNTNATTGGTTSGDPNDPSGFGSNNINPATVDKIMGYTSQTVSPDGAGSGDATNALSRSLGGSGGGGSGAGSGSGADIGSGDSTSLGSTSAGGRTSGATGLNGNKVGGAGGKESDSSANISGGKSDGAQGYMFWGVPARKKKAPLTLLKPANTPATQTPDRKPAQNSPSPSGIVTNPN